MNNPISNTDPLGDSVRYRSFGDRIRVGLKRLSRSFNEQFNAYKDNSTVYTYGLKENSPRLADAQPDYGRKLSMDEYLQGDWNNYNIDYSIGGKGSSFLWFIPGTEVEIGGKHIPVTLREGSRFGGDASTTDRAVLRRRVPGFPVTLNADNIPDWLQVNDVTNSRVILPSTLYGGISDVGRLYVNSFNNPLTNTFSFTPTTSGKLVVSSFSTSSNATLGGPSRTSNNTSWRVTYEKYVGLHFKITLPAIR